MILVNTPDMNISGIWGTYYSWGVLLTAIFSLGLGSFVLIKGYKRLLNIYWFLLAFSVSLWSFFIYLWSVATDYYSALVYNRIANYNAIFIATFVVIFMEEFIRKSNRIISKISVGIGVFIFILGIISPHYFIPSLSPKTFFKLYPDAGIIYWFFTIFFVSAWSYSVYILYKFWRVSSGVIKKQAGIVLMGLMISIIGGSANFFPVFNINIFPFSSPFSLIYVFLTSYAIIRYRLMEIDTVIHRTIMWAVTVVLLVVPACVVISGMMEWLVDESWIVRTGILAGMLLLFLGYYHKLKPYVDHIFRRRKYDYQKELLEIPTRVGTELELSVLVERLFKELKEVLYVENAVLEVKVPEEEKWEEIGSMGYERLAEKGIERRQERLGKGHKIVEWLKERGEVLEKEQIEINPEYESIREEARRYMEGNALEVVVPLVFEGEVTGILGLGKKENLQSYRMKDLELLEHLGRQISISIDNALHHKDIVEKQRLEQELKLGRELQESLLPRERPEVEGYRVYGMMKSAREIGGDYYDFIEHKGGEGISLAIGDVSGKGLDAGIVMAMTKTIIYSFALERGLGPREVLRRANEILYFHVSLRKFVTLLYFEVKGGEGVVRYSSAGHERILVKRGKEVEVIKSGGVLLGMIEDLGRFLEERSLNLGRGDKILLYTDGATEARNPGGEMYGLGRLVESFKKHGDFPIQEAIGKMYQDIKDFISSGEQYDDITFVGIEKL